MQLKQVSFIFILGALNDKMYVLKGIEEEEEEHADENGKHPDITLDLKNFAKIYSSVILSPGQVVSMTLLNQKGLFRKHIAGYTGKELMLKVTKY